MIDLKGSFTIEAAVVVPITMVIMVAMVFMSFFAYDKTTLTAVCDYALMETAGKTENNTGQIQSEVSGLLVSRLLAASDIKVSAGGSDMNAYIESSASFGIPMLMIQTLFGYENMNFSSRLDVSNLNGRKKLLLYKSILDGADSLTEKMK